MIAEAIGQLKVSQVAQEGDVSRKIDLLLTVRRGFLGRIDIRAELRGPEISNPRNRLEIHAYLGTTKTKSGNPSSAQSASLARQPQLLLGICAD